jgi:hypothetical protein
LSTNCPPIDRNDVHLGQLILEVYVIGTYSARDDVQNSGWALGSAGIRRLVRMVTTANLQYGWTLFVTPIDQKYH